MPQLIEILDIMGCVLTIGVLGMQKDIVEKIAEVGADYILVIKRD